MALALGTNCGFVTEAPTDDPAAASVVVTDNVSRAAKDTSPATAAKITEVGWWCDTATQESNFEVGLYSDDGTGEPNLLLEVSTTNAKGTTSGWKRVTGLNWTISSSTAYWIALQLDDTATTTNIDSSASGGGGYARKTSASTSLPSPDWEISSSTDSDGMHAIYAVWEAAAAEGTNIKINVGDAWKEVSAIKVNVDDTWKEVTSAKINEGDAWKTVF